MEDELFIASLVMLLLVPLAFIPANIAKKKGRSFGSWWLLGFCFFLPALIAALVMEDKSQPMMTYPASGRPCAYQAWGDQAGGIHLPEGANVQEDALDYANDIDQIWQLKELFDCGVITQEEFARGKRLLLGIEASAEDVVDSRSSFDEVKELKALLDEGVITQREFELKKASVLGVAAGSAEELHGMDALTASGTEKASPETRNRGEGNNREAASGQEASRVAGFAAAAKQLSSKLVASRGAMRAKPPAQKSAYEEPAAILKDYKELLDMGAITQEDFDSKKRELLSL